MELRFANYVGASERKLPEIAVSIRQSRQNCEHWVKRDLPIYVRFDPKNIEAIIEVVRREVLYPRRKQQSKRKVRQVKK